MSRLRVAALADALVDRRLLDEERGAYRCAHPVIADVVRESLTPARRRELHRAIALALVTDRKSTRLNSSHDQISYAVFCLEKKNLHYQQVTHATQLEYSILVC